MKFIISLFIVWSFNGKSQAPIVVDYAVDFALASKVSHILQENYQIPQMLIELRSSDHCHCDKKDHEIHLCINANKELVTLEYDEEFVGESLKIFRN